MYFCRWFFRKTKQQNGMHLFSRLKEDFRYHSDLMPYFILAWVMRIYQVITEMDTPFTKIYTCMHATWNSCVERASSNSIEIETWFLMVINRLHIGLFYRESFWIEDNVSLNTKYYNPYYTIHSVLAYGFDFISFRLCVSAASGSAEISSQPTQWWWWTRNNNNNKRRSRKKSFLSLYAFFFVLSLWYFGKDGTENSLAKVCSFLFVVVFHLLLRSCEYRCNVFDVYIVVCSCSTIE